VINTNLPHILHRFGNTAFQMSKIYIWLPLLRLNPPTEGFPGMISVKFSTDVIGWPRYQTAEKNCRKFQPAELGAR